LKNKKLQNFVLSMADNGTAEKNLIKNYFQQNPIRSYLSSWVDDAVTKSNDFYISVKNQNGGMFNRVTAALSLIDTSNNRLTRIRAMNPNIISFKEEKFIRKILDSIRNIEIDIRCATYGGLAQSLEEEWKAQGFDTCNNEGYLSKIMIRLMNNSYNFWINYPYEITGKTTALPLWAGLDILGGIAGAASSIISDVSNGNNVNWVNAGGQALVGAAAGSIAGSRWFLKLFK
jgi:hypothetical protein